VSASTHLGLIYALIGALFAACFLIPWKVATLHGSAEDATLLLLAWAALFNTLTAALLPEERKAQHASSLAPTLKLSIAFAALSLAGNWLSAQSVQRISGALLSVLQRCDVLVVGLLGPILLGERARPSFWAGASIAALGLFLLGSPAGDAIGRAPQAELSGALFGLGSALCFGLMVVLTRKYIHMLQPVLLNALRLWLSVALWFAVERRWPTVTAPLLLHTALAALFGPFGSRLAVMFSGRARPRSPP
jgi:drug/metabolite transporter (DMT)-like permease